jgi:hypothetical protein
MMVKTKRNTTTHSAFTPGRFDYLLVSEPERCHAEALAEDAVRAETTRAERMGLIPAVHVTEGEEPEYEYLSFHEVMIRSVLATLPPDATPEERRAAEAIIREVPFPTQLEQPAPSLELLQGGRNEDDLPETMEPEA